MTKIVEDTENRAVKVDQMISEGFALGFSEKIQLGQRDFLKGILLPLWGHAKIEFARPDVSVKEKKKQKRKIEVSVSNIFYSVCNDDKKIPEASAKFTIQQLEDGYRNNVLDLIVSWDGSIKIIDLDNTRTGETTNLGSRVGFRENRKDNNHIITIASNGDGGCSDVNLARAAAVMGRFKKRLESNLGLT